MLGIRNSLAGVLFLCREVGLCGPGQGKNQKQKVQDARAEESLGVSKDRYLRTQYLLFAMHNRNLNQFMNFKHY